MSFRGWILTNAINTYNFDNSVTRVNNSCNNIRKEGKNCKIVPSCDSSITFLGKEETTCNNAT